MSFKILGHVIHNVSLPPTQKLVLIVLADFYNDESGKAWPSQNTLCTVTGLSPRSINRAISELKRKGYIRVWKERSAGQYSHNVYRINHTPQRHIVEEAGVKNDQTTCQKVPKPCATVAHYPLTTLKNTLDHVSNKKDRIVGLPKTPEEFQKLPSFLRYHYWYHKPDVQRMLRKSGIMEWQSTQILKPN